MEYNPYANIEVAEKEEVGKVSKDNPYQSLKKYPERKPLERKDLPRLQRPWRPLEEMTPAEREEYDFAQEHPTLHKLVDYSLSVCTMLPGVNYLKYLSAEERHDLSELSEEEQTVSLLHMSLDNALWAAFGAVPKGSKLLKLGIPERSAASGVWEASKMAGRVGTRTLKKAFPAKYSLNSARTMKDLGSRKAVSLLRVEDALKKIAILAPEVDFKGFQFGEHTAKVLKKSRFHKKEIELLVNPLRKGKGRLSAGEAYEFGELAKTKHKFSKAFQQALPEVDGVRTLNPEWAALHSEALMEASYRKKTFEKALGELYGAKEVAGLAKDFSLKTFQQNALKLYPKMGKTFNFGEVTEEQLANITLSVLENPVAGMAAVSPGSKGFVFPSLLPKRVVYGIGEAIHSTKSKVYEPLKGALGKRNREYFNNMLLWAQLLKQEGLYTSLKINKIGEFTMKKAEFFTPEVSEKVYGLLRKMDDLTEAAGKAKTTQEAKALLSEARLLPKKSFSKNDPGILLFNAYRTYSDHLYSSFTKAQFSRVLGKLRSKGDLPEDILSSLSKQSRNLEYSMDNLFSTVSKATPSAKMGNTKRLLGQAQRTILRGAEGLSKEELAKREAAAKLFQYNSKEGFPAYLENYVKRLRAGQLKLVNEWRGQLTTQPRAAFTQARKKVFGEESDFATVLENQTMAQASELQLYDSIGDVVKFAKKLPPAYRDYVDADIAATLGLPSAIDHKTAWFLTKTVGKFERFFGKQGIWDEWRVLDLAHTVNTLTYMGALGFKPFSAIRNLFQLPMNVPADLGGIKDLGTLARGMKKSFDPAVREKLISWGAITEFAPEVHLRPQALPFGKKKLFGKTLPSLQKTQDAALWMFKFSDRHIRYMTGGAALEKWEVALASVGGKVNIKNIEAFTKKLNIAGRRDYVQDDIIKALLAPKQQIKQAEKTFVLDVLADTQYLYGVSDAPLILRKYGAIGRTGFIFQSWAMNYLALLEKWVVTGEPIPAKVNRLFTAMTSSAISASLIETIWSEKTSAATVGLGPIPGKVDEFLIPPAWTPVYHTLMAIKNCTNAELSSQHAKKILTTGSIMIPGSLQAKASLRGIKEEGFAGFAKSIIKYNPTKDKTSGW